MFGVSLPASGMIDAAYRVVGEEATMGMTLIGRAAALWFVILLLAIANGVLRERVLIPRLGVSGGLVLSGVLLAAFIMTVAFIGVGWLGSRDARGLLLVGAAWLVATLLFEFGFGLARGKPLAEILAAYTFRDGNLWPLVLAVTALAPWLAGKLRGWL